MIRPMNSSDIGAVVKVHLSSFPGFFLSSLGSRFLSLFYQDICSSPKGIAFVYINHADKLTGFVAGASNPSGFYSSLLRRKWFKFAFASIIPIFKNPSTIRRILRAISQPSNSPIGSDVAGLFSIGVLPEAQGSGAGKKLVTAFLISARKRGSNNIFLTTDRDDNEAVNAFYDRLGFELAHQYVTPEGRRMNEYRISLKDEAKGPIPGTPTQGHMGSSGMDDKRFG